MNRWSTLEGGVWYRDRNESPAPGRSSSPRPAHIPACRILISDWPWLLPPDSTAAVFRRLEFFSLLDWKPPAAERGWDSPDHLPSVLGNPFRKRPRPPRYRSIALFPAGKKLFPKSQNGPHRVRNESGTDGRPDRRLRYRWRWSPGFFPGKATACLKKETGIEEATF